VSNSLRMYPATEACDTTGVRRFQVVCACLTYKDNWGVCAAFEEGANGRCVYCDHTELCHRNGGSGIQPTDTVLA
jgi:hypothetical protein